MIGVSGIASAQTAGEIQAIGVENEYADVIAQIGGKYVNVQSILTDPNTDPHTFEANPSIAKQIASAQLIVENGVGYDDWADKHRNRRANRGAEPPLWLSHRCHSRA